MDTSDHFPLETRQQRKALTHPLRLRILEMLADRPRTNEELAGALGEQSGKLYFHTRTLLAAGLIVLDHTRAKGPITEKVYRAAARRFLVPPPVKGGTAAPLEWTLASALELYQTNWRASGGLPDDTEIGFHLILTLSPTRRQEFAARVRALFEDFQAGDDAGAVDTRPVSLAVLMHSFGLTKGDTDAILESNSPRPADGGVGADGASGPGG